MTRPYPADIRAIAARAIEKWDQEEISFEDAVCWGIAEDRATRPVPPKLSHRQRECLSLLSGGRIVSPHEIASLCPGSQERYAQPLINRLRRKGIAISNIRGRGWRLERAASDGAVAA